MFRLNFDLSAQSFDISFHNIHPHATAGYVANHLGSGKAWFKDQVKYLSIAKRISITNDSFFYGFGNQFLTVKAFPVVFYLYHYASRRMIG